MSVPQSNSTHTTEKPVVDDDLTRRTSVAPLTAVSMGKVTRRSTSSDAMPCASVMTTTVGALRSGKTSTSILHAVQMPTTMSSTLKNRMTGRLCNEKEIILFNTISECFVSIFLISQAKEVIGSYRKITRFAREVLANTSGKAERMDKSPCQLNDDAPQAPRWRWRPDAPVWLRVPPPCRQP